MPTIPGIKFLTIRTIVQGINKPMSFTTYWECDTAPSGQPQVKSMINDWQTVMAGVLAPLLPDQVSVPLSTAVYTFGTDYFDAASDAGLSFDGNAATVLLEPPGSQVLPDQDALIVQKRTGLQGRSNRGRMYIPGIWEGFNREGILDAAGYAAAGAFAASVGSDKVIGGMTCHARHYSKKLNTAVVITECRAMRLFGSQRSRDTERYNLPIS